MKKVDRTQAIKKINSSTSELIEYSDSLQDKDIDFCINRIVGRYPATGYCSNEICKEICYILEGSGSITSEKLSIMFDVGDVILINPGDVYYWKGDCSIVMICTPAWYKDQCKFIENT